MNELRIQRLESAADRRGDSFHIPQSVFEFMAGINEMHYVTIEPGGVRGNHCHRGRKEFMFVFYQSPWILAWRRPGARNISVKEFGARGGIGVEIAPEVVHAVKNKGDKILHLVSCSDAPYVPSDTERVVILE